MIRFFVYPECRTYRLMCCALTYLLTLAPLHVGQGHGTLVLSTFSLFIVPGASDGAKLQHYTRKAWTRLTISRFSVDRTAVAHHTARSGSRALGAAVGRCHREFGTPSFRHPHSEYPSVFVTGVQNSLRVFGIPPCTTQGILHPPLRKRMYQRAHHVPARACTEVVNGRAKNSRRAHEPSRYSVVQSELGCNSQPIGEGVLYQMDRVSLGVRFRSYKAVSWT